VTLTEAERTERNILALTIWGEARGEAVEGRIAVACVIHNRLIDGRWAHGYAAVCQQPYQFSCWNESDPNRAKLLVLLTELERYGSAGPVLGECLWIADGMIAGKILPRVKHATHYHTKAIVPNWAHGAEVVATIGSHLFYEGVK
jgi:spore germination cell wall hydrolase CwlJ-like protein